MGLPPLGCCGERHSEVLNRFNRNTKPDSWYGRDRLDTLKEAAEIEPEIIKIRREIHQKPELAYREEVTSKLFAERLEARGIQVKRGVGGTGDLRLLKGPRPGKEVACR